MADLKDEWTLEGKVVVVTGASSGIGMESCRMLLEEGCHVIMACRSVEKGERCKMEITEGDSKKILNCNVTELNLASLESIRKFALQTEKDHKNIHLLVNNAGVFCRRKTLSQDAMELSFAVNHLGHFYLTRLLLPQLIKSQPARVITVSSEAHRLSAPDLNDLQMTLSWSSLRSYARSKSANVLFSCHLARLLKDTRVSTYCLHPGVVETHLGDDLKGSCFMRLFKCLYFFRPLMTPREGSMTTLHCCKSPLLSGQSGLYYSDCKVKGAKRHSTEVKRAQDLWNISSELCGLKAEL